MSKLLDKKATKAQTLWIQGFDQNEIASKMQCTTRTVRRYLTYDLPEDSDEITEIDPTLRGKFLSRAEPLMLQMVDRLQEQLDADVIKSRDLIVACGVLFDKIARLSPPPPAEDSPKREVPTFILQTRDETVESEVQARLKAAGVVEGECVEVGQDTDKDTHNGADVDNTGDNVQVGI